VLEVSIPIDTAELARQVNRLVIPFLQADDGEIAAGFGDDLDVLAQPGRAAVVDDDEPASVRLRGDDRVGGPRSAVGTGAVDRDDNGLFGRERHRQRLLEPRPGVGGRPLFRETGGADASVGAVDPLACDTIGLGHDSRERGAVELVVDQVAHRGDRRQAPLQLATGDLGKVAVRGRREAFGTGLHRHRRAGTVRVRLRTGHCGLVDGRGRGGGAHLADTAFHAHLDELVEFECVLHG